MLEWVAMPFSRGIFLTQGSNLGVSHCRQILYCLSHRGGPGSVYMSIRISRFHHCLFPTSVPTSLLYMGVSIPALPIGSSICTCFSRFHVFVEFHIFHTFSRFHDIYFSLSDFTLYDRLWVHQHLYNRPNFILLYG